MTTVSAQTADQRASLTPSLMALGAGIVWSLGALTIRSTDGTDVWQYMIWRSVGIIVVVESLSRLRGQRSPTLVAYTSGRPMLIATASLWLSSLAFVYAMKHTTAANASFLASMSPLLTVVAARAVLGERMSSITRWCLGAATVGLVIMVASDVGAGSMDGNVAAILSAVGFAGYTVAVRSDRGGDWSPVMPGYALMMIVVCSAVTLGTGGSLVPPVTHIALAMVHGGFMIVVGTALFNHAARSVPAVAMTVYAQTEMVFVPLWIFLRFNERPAASALLGGLVILGSVTVKAIVDGAGATDG